MGWLLARYTELDRPTATLGMIAGGASGIVGDVRRPRRRRPARRVHAVRPRAGRRPAHAAADRRVRRRRGGGSGPAEPAFATPPTGCSPPRSRPSARSPRAAPNVPAGTLLGPMFVAGRARPGRRRLRRPAGRPGARVRADRPAGRPALHPRHRQAARPPADPGARRRRRPARRLVPARPDPRRRRPTSRSGTPTSPRPPAASTPCSRSPSAPTPTPRSSSASRRCALLVAVLLAPLVVRRIRGRPPHGDADHA